MKTFLARGFTALAVGALSFGLFTSTASASGKDGAKPSGAVAVVNQQAGNSNSTSQSSTAAIDNKQENKAKPSTFDWKKFGKPGHSKPGGGKPDHGKPDVDKPCECNRQPYDGKPDHGKPDHGKPDHGKPAPAGDVNQDNDATNEATSGTANATDQGIAQTGTATVTSDAGDDHGKPCGCDGKPDDGYGNPDHGYEKPDDGYENPDHGKPCGCDGKPDHGKPDHGKPGPDGGDATAIVDQEAGNSNSTDQDSTATVDNDQSNLYEPETHGSPGAGSGDVNQGNDATNTAESGTENETNQGIVQEGAAEATTESGGGCGCHGGSGDAAAVVDQTAGNSNETDQTSTATVDNDQTNIYVPINLLSPGAGSGDVNQGNDTTNTAESATVNETNQGIAQEGAATAGSEGGSGDAVAVVGQTAGNENSTVQDSSAEVTNHQLNIAIPINVGSPGAGSGDINQSNDATNTASSLTGNSTTQGIAQVASAVSTVTG